MIIGMDAGGTHTKASLFHEEGSVIDTIVIESRHPLQYGYDTCAQNLASLVVQLCDKNDVDLCAVSAGIGLAGYGQDTFICTQINRAFRATMPCAYSLVSDVKIALHGALHGEDGIVVIAGTGSIACAKKGNCTYRAGGYGYQIGDEGSAYWIGKKLLEIFSKQCDGRLAKTRLYDTVCKTLNLQEAYEIISYVELHSTRKDIAGLATIVYQLAKQCDKHALAIYEEAGKELASLVNTLYTYCGKGVQVSYIGGVFQSKQYILEPFKKYSKHDIQLIEPIYPPEKGAYLIRQKEMVR